MMKVGSKGLALIKEFEGFSSKPYLCPAGIPTIGYGNTFYSNGSKVTLKDAPIPEQEASTLLEYVANKSFGEYINKVLKVEVTQNQFDALVSFAYNLGNGNLASSTLLKKVNSKDFVGASNEFLKWNKANGKVLKGLTARREAEKALFMKGT